MWSLIFKVVRNLNAVNYYIVQMMDIQSSHKHSFKDVNCAPDTTGNFED